MKILGLFWTLKNSKTQRTLFNCWTLGFEIASAGYGCQCVCDYTYRIVRRKLIILQSTKRGFFRIRFVNISVLCPKPYKALCPTPINALDSHSDWKRLVFPFYQSGACNIEAWTRIIPILCGSSEQAIAMGHYQKNPTLVLVAVMVLRVCSPMGKSHLRTSWCLTQRPSVLMSNACALKVVFPILWFATERLGVKTRGMLRWASNRLILRCVVSLCIGLFGAYISSYFREFAQRWNIRSCYLRPFPYHQFLSSEAANRTFRKLIAFHVENLVSKVWINDDWKSLVKKLCTV